MREKVRNIGRDTERQRDRDIQIETKRHGETEGDRE